MLKGSRGARGALTFEDASQTVLKVVCYQTGYSRWRGKSVFLFSVAGSLRTPFRALSVGLSCPAGLGARLACATDRTGEFTSGGAPDELFLMLWEHVRPTTDVGGFEPLALTETPSGWSGNPDLFSEGNQRDGND